MIVLFVSECERQALKKSRRILNRYARQIGRRTWLTRISQEGLKDIHAALRNVSSRQMAVSCHRICSRSRTELVWVVGTRRHFDHDGHYAFSSSKRDFLRPPREAAPMERLCAYLAELAGLFHDLGKDNAFFQNKLWQAITTSERLAIADPVRHELLSLMQAGKLATLASGVKRLNKVEDTAWLPVFSHLSTLSSLFSSTSALFNEEGGWNVDQSHEKDHQFPLPKPKESNVLLWSWLFLLSSHHRLPFGYWEAGETAPSLQKQSHIRSVSDGADYEQQLADNLRPAQTLSRPWQQEVRWFRQVANCAGRINHWLSNHQSLLLEPQWQDAFLRIIIQFGRTGMMCADHSVSAKDNQKSTYDKKGTLIANTAKISGQTQPGAVLGTHLFNVGKQAGSLTRSLWQPNLGMPFIAGEDIPAPMRPDAGEAENSRFIWQDAACKALKSVAKAGADTGFIGFVQADTGSGKTRACARMMAALGPEVRYTVALGLRTLTLQTGDSYRKDLELTAQQVTTLVGESLITRLQAESEAQGSESRGAWSDEEITVDGDYCDDALPKALNDMLEGEDKHKQLLMAPVLVCTADHITAASDATRGRHLIATMRVMSADLVLDEVDNYDETALVALGKLVYLTALSGRRVLLSSATLTPAISESLFLAYIRGYNAYAKRRGFTEPQVATGWFSQFKALCEVKWFRQSDLSAPDILYKKFVRRQTAYAQSLVKKMDEEPARRSTKWLTLPKQCGMTELVDGIYEAARVLHNRFAATDPETGKQLSCGLVRVSRVRHCWEISRILCNQTPDEQWDHQVVCYHARLSSLARWHTEQWLDTAMNRKNPEAIWQEPVLRKLLDNSSAQNIMVIVVATPVEEVGRDHDFDWGIFEPSSTRSVVQSAGRIWRHRFTAQRIDNIMLLPAAIDEIINPGQQKAVYRHPGVESNPDYLLSVHQAENILPKDWTERLDARHSLIEPSTSEAELTYLEHKKQRDYLLSDSPARNRDSERTGYSLTEWSEQPLLSSNDRHAYGNPFRKRERRILYWQNQEGYWWHTKLDAARRPVKGSERVSAESQINDTDVNACRLLLNGLFPANEWQEHYQTLKERAYADAGDEYAEQSLLGFEVRENNGQSSIAYHFWLGAG